MATMRRARDSDDDGFDDFLSEDEEECALQTQEMAALARKMKTVGVREAIEFGKESSLQEGFDAGFHAAARDAFRFSAMRGALCVVRVSGLTQSLEATQAQELDACIEKLRVRSLRVPTVALTDPAAIVDGVAAEDEATAQTTTESEQLQEDEVLAQSATQWLRSLGLPADALQ